MVEFVLMTNPRAPDGPVTALQGTRQLTMDYVTRLILVYAKKMRKNAQIQKEYVLMKVRPQRSLIVIVRHVGALVAARSKRVLLGMLRRETIAATMIRALAPPLAMGGITVATSTEITPTLCKYVFK
jgi:hypothetical protein